MRRFIKINDNEFIEEKVETITSTTGTIAYVTICLFALIKAASLFL